jgi:DNA-binding response OmpR family regulator
MDKMRIGILEDEPELAVHVARALSTAGYSCFVFHRGQKLISFLNHETLDLLLLDWNVPDVSGLSVIRWVKEHLPKAPPILMLTSRTSEEDIVTALQAGADDFLIKPVEQEALKSRIEAIRRRADPERSEAGVELFGSFRFDTRSETLMIDGAPVQLTAKEYALALMLFRNLHRALSRSYIFKALWEGNPNTQTRTLDMHISKLRVKLGLRPSRGFRLVPVYAYGYRLETIE